MYNMVEQIDSCGQAHVNAFLSDLLDLLAGPE